MNNYLYFSSNKSFKLINKPNTQYFRLEDFTLSPVREKLTSKELRSKKILLFRSPGLGDLIMSTPAIQALKKAVPSCSISLLTSSQAAQVTPLISGLDQVITFDAPWDKLNFRQNPQKIQQLISKISRQKFDVGIIFTVVGQDPLPAGLIMYLAGIERRIAYSKYKPYQLLTDWIPDYEPEKYFRHEVDRELELLKTIGVLAQNKSMHLTLPRDILTQVKSILKQKGIDVKRKIIVCHIGSTDIKRIYPSEGYQQIARELIALGYQVIFTGVKSEQELIEEVVETVGGGVFNLAGLLNFPQMCGLIKICDLLISNNTSPVHIASALKTPVLDLYARTNPQHIPWLTKHKVLYFDVYMENRLKILTQLPPRVVVKSALNLLGNSYTMQNKVYAKDYHSHSHL